MEDGSKSIGVVDYGSGNLRSVCKALESVGASVSLVTKSPNSIASMPSSCPESERLATAQTICAPPDFGNPCVNGCRQGGRILEFALATNCSSNRARNHQGAKAWGFFRDALSASAEKSLKSPISDGIHCARRAVPYITHSPWTRISISCIRIFRSPLDDDIVSARCEYGGSFAASISAGSLHATQFHPEKSQSSGLTLLKNFLETLA